MQYDIEHFKFFMKGYFPRAFGRVSGAAAGGIFIPDYPVMWYPIKSPFSVGRCYFDLVEMISPILKISKVLGLYKLALLICRKGQSIFARTRLLDGVVE